MYRSVINKTNLKVGSYHFEQIEKFKYLGGVNINEKINIYNEIQIWIKAANHAHFTMNQMLRSKMLSKKHERKTVYLLLVLIGNVHT
jgi:hypothetical protein